MSQEISKEEVSLCYPLNYSLIDQWMVGYTALEALNPDF